MAEFLTTKGISYFLEHLFKSSKEYIYIVTPYIKISPQLEERIIDALDNGMKIILIYGKDKGQLKHINFASRIELLYYENLHAKFYINEQKILITSMNMHSFSEENNREIGVLFSREEPSDENVMNDCIIEFNSIKKKAININGDSVNLNNQQNEKIDISKIKKYEEEILNSKYYKIVESIICDKLGVDESDVFPNASFTSDLGADSLDLVELVMEFESTFDLSISDEDAEKIITIGQAVKYLDNKQPKVTLKPNGYCIRTGESIPFNLEKPMCYEAYKSWSKFSDADYAEKFCHFSGEASNGNTSVSRPILKKNWKRAKEIFGFK